MGINKSELTTHTTTDLELKSNQFNMADLPRKKDSISRNSLLKLKLEIKTGFTRNKTNKIVKVK